MQDERMRTAGKNRRPGAAKIRSGWGIAAYTVNRIVGAKPWIIAATVVVVIVSLAAAGAVLLTALEHRLSSGEASHDTQWHVFEFVRRTLGSDDVNVGESVVMKSALIGVSLLGVVLVGTVAGSATEGIGRWMRRLQKGRTPVVERDHTVLV